TEDDESGQLGDTRQPVALPHAPDVELEAGLVEEVIEPARTLVRHVLDEYDAHDSEERQVAVELERSDLAPVVLPLLSFVAQEEIEDVLTERLGDELRPLHELDRVGQRAGQRLDAERA